MRNNADELENKLEIILRELDKYSRDVEVMACTYVDYLHVTVTIW